MLRRRLNLLFLRYPEIYYRKSGEELVNWNNRRQVSLNLIQLSAFNSVLFVLKTFINFNLYINLLHCRWYLKNHVRGE